MLDSPRPAPAESVSPGGPGPGPARPTVRPYLPGDERGILESFNEVFAPSEEGRRPRTLEEWTWLFPGNPAGMRVWVAVDGERVAAHYASQPRRTWVDGQVGVFTQIVDSFVHPDYRQGAAYAGLFAEVGDGMLASTVGAGKDLIAYGWPTERALRVGARRLGYLPVRADVALSREPGPGPCTLPATTRELGAFDESVERLYWRCAAEWGASTIRDARYLDWRVFQRPGRPYRVLAEIAPGGELAGYATLLSASWPKPRSVLLCDWLVPAPDVDAGARLLEACLAAARAAGAEILLALFPSWSPWFERFRAQGFFAGPTGYAMVSGTYNDPRYPPEWLRERWWYQPLDLDLF